MKILKIMIIVLVLCMVSISALNCASESDQTQEPESQIATVERGDIRIDITASGNLALSTKEELAFDLFYKEGTVEEVLVEESESVKEGQVLAKLDTSEWEDNLAVLEDNITTAERALTAKQRILTAKERALTAAEQQVNTKERALTDKQRTLTAAERQVSAKELALRQAQVSLQTAEYNLSQIEDVKRAQDEVDDAELNLKIIQEFVSGTLGSPGIWAIKLQDAQARLTAANNQLQYILDENNITITTDVALEVATKKLQVEQAQSQVNDADIAIADARISVDDARLDVDDARLDIDDARLDIDDARLDIDDAQTAVGDAQKNTNDAQDDLDDAKSKSSEVIAPFDGFITRVNVEGGDLVQKGTVAVVLAKANKFEADVLVNEMDIFQVKLGSEASVQVDAMQGMTLPAKVTHIAPTATIQQGVVNYTVKVEIESPEAIHQEHQEARQQAMGDISSGQLPERLRQAIEEGRMTQEQAEQIVERMQQGESGQQRPMPQMVPQDFQLREGLTVTVSILVDERNDVLMVPNRAITWKGTESMVQVVKDGVVEERTIKTGISDYQNTEVTEGLSEGETVVISQKTATTAPTTQQQRPPGMIPGMGRPH